MGSAILASGLLTAAYAGRLLLLVYGPGPRRKGVRRPGRGEVAGLGALAAMSVLLGLLWLPGGEGVVEVLAEGELEQGALGSSRRACSASRSPEVGSSGSGDVGRSRHSDSTRLYGRRWPIGSVSPPSPGS